jgi:hypothetical protein
MANTFKSLNRLAERLRNDLNNTDDKKYILIFAHNGTGKTRLSMEFKKKIQGKGERGTLYFNAFTEDLFYWDNDLENDTNRVLRLNKNSKFFSGLNELEMENRIAKHLDNYSDFSYKIDYEAGYVTFFRNVIDVRTQQNNRIDDIKVSRGEENLFIWCFFLAIAQLAMDGAVAYQWVKYIYIDDPISSLDENNTIAIAVDLARLLKEANSIKFVISTHHNLFFNIMANELREGSLQYYYHKPSDGDKYTLKKIEDIPSFHHIALIKELQTAIAKDKLYTYHFNVLRNIMEKTAVFLGHTKFSFWMPKDDKALYARAINLLSHGGYSVYDAKEMVPDNKELLKRIFNEFTARFPFNLEAVASDSSNDTSTNPSSAQAD